VQLGLGLGRPQSVGGASDATGPWARVGPADFAQALSPTLAVAPHAGPRPPSAAFSARLAKLCGAVSSLRQSDPGRATQAAGQVLRSLIDDALSNTGLASSAPGFLDPTSNPLFAEAPSLSWKLCHAFHLDAPSDVAERRAAFEMPRSSYTAPPGARHTRPRLLALACFTQQLRMIRVPTSALSVQGGPWSPLDGTGRRAAMPATFASTLSPARAGAAQRGGAHAALDGAAPRSVAEALTRQGAIDAVFPPAGRSEHTGEDAGSAGSSSSQAMPHALVPSLAPVLLALAGGPVGWAPSDAALGPQAACHGQAWAGYRPPLQHGGLPSLSSSSSSSSSSSAADGGGDAAGRAAIAAAVPRAAPAMRAALASAAAELSAGAAAADIGREGKWLSTGRPRAAPPLPGHTLGEDADGNARASCLVASFTRPAVLLAALSGRPRCDAPVVISVLRPASGAEMRFLGVTPQVVASEALALAKRQKRSDRGLLLAAEAQAEAAVPARLSPPPLVDATDAASTAYGVPPEWASAAERCGREAARCADLATGSGSGLRVRIRGLGRWLVSRGAEATEASIRWAQDRAVARLGGTTVGLLIGAANAAASKLGAAAVVDAAEALALRPASEAEQAVGLVTPSLPPAVAGCRPAAPRPSGAAAGSAMGPPADVLSAKVARGDLESAMSPRGAVSVVLPSLEGGTGRAAAAEPSRPVVAPIAVPGIAIVAPAAPAAGPGLWSGSGAPRAEVAPPSLPPSSEQEQQPESGLAATWRAVAGGLLSSASEADALRPQAAVDAAAASSRASSSGADLDPARPRAVSAAGSSSGRPGAVSLLPATSPHRPALSVAHTSLQSVDGGDGDVGTLAGAVEDDSDEPRARRARGRAPPGLIGVHGLGAAVGARGEDAPPPTPVGMSVGGGVRLHDGGFAPDVPHFPLPGSAVPSARPSQSPAGAEQQARAAVVIPAPGSAAIAGAFAARADTDAAGAPRADAAVPPAAAPQSRKRSRGFADASAPADAPAPDGAASSASGPRAVIPRLGAAADAASARALRTHSLLRAGGAETDARGDGIILGMILPPPSGADLEAALLSLPRAHAPSPLVTQTFIELLRCANSSLAPAVPIPASGGPHSQSPSSAMTSAISAMQRASASAADGRGTARLELDAPRCSSLLAYVSSLADKVKELGAGMAGLAAGLAGLPPARSKEVAQLAMRAAAAAREAMDRDDEEGGPAMSTVLGPGGVLPPVSVRVARAAAISGRTWIAQGCSTAVAETALQAAATALSAGAAPQEDQLEATLAAAATEAVVRDPFGAWCRLADAAGGGGTMLRRREAGGTEPTAAAAVSAGPSSSNLRAWPRVGGIRWPQPAAFARDPGQARRAGGGAASPGSSTSSSDCGDLDGERAGHAGPRPARDLAAGWVSRGAVAGVSATLP